MSGRKVELGIWVRGGDQDRTGHAMQALKDSMAWDERVYGREYDLDLFNIVAVSDFNMGAMENKGLNIFNTRYILADPDTATDVDYDGVEGVVAHEYFHNWSGNRVTCRDWFQLSLKEGFTVFRDQSFSADMGSPAVKRIEDVRLLRAAQFPEDAGPLAHPIRPDSFQEISNFYTATIYNKGAEIIRMMATMVRAGGRPAPETVAGRRGRPLVARYRANRATDARTAREAADDDAAAPGGLCDGRQRRCARRHAGDGDGRDPAHPSRRIFGAARAVGQSQLFGTNHNRFRTRPRRTRLARRA